MCSSGEFKIHLRTPDAYLPERGTPHSAGYDLRTPSDVSIAPGTQELIDIGQSWQIPEGYFGKLFSRSSVACKGVDCKAGVIDSDYRGPVKALLYNYSANTVSFNRGDKVCQVVLLPHLSVPVLEVASAGDLDDSVRGEGGFGHTGR
ncbi:deoxyuridine triphosphate nucleotidohydrolase [Kipferlia bialata]|uniref:Deoxyuridine 5'-triphosphate nucleotidohydrolase n=1 Tax=Kipferlia bialata TaxID=797122 RepID=A0A9K3D023_9EUKA|nr:deoxyuridine triphosphate nucleotidohydrolase [Kipferlia bialata]|eukprot:g7397.t1